MSRTCPLLEHLEAAWMKETIDCPTICKLGNFAIILPLVRHVRMLCESFDRGCIFAQFCDVTSFIDDPYYYFSGN